MKTGDEIAIDLDCHDAGGARGKGSGESAARSLNAFSLDPAPSSTTALRAVPALESPNQTDFLRVVFDTSVFVLNP